MLLLLLLLLMDEACVLECAVGISYREERWERGWVAGGC